MQLFLQGRQAAHHFKQEQRRNSDEIPSPPIFYSAALLLPPAEHIGSCPAKGAQCQTAAHQNRAAVTVLGFFPDLERTQTGKAITRQGPNFKDGRPKKFTQEQIELALSLLEQGKTYRQITQMAGIRKSTVIRERNCDFRRYAGYKQIGIRGGIEGSGSSV